MHEFIAKHEDKITGTLSGFDRLVFRGTLRSIAHDQGMMRYLWANQVLLKDFGSHVEQVSRRLKEASLAEAEASGRPVRYLNSGQVSKEEIAHRIAAQEGIRDGLVCVLSCVEPCWSFEIHRNREKKRLELEPRYRKCLFLYYYWLHPVLGFMNARIQTWFPFPGQVCLNGREWLARQMDAAGLEYVRQDNCFPWIADWAQAQRLMDRQLKAHWPKLLDGIARQLNPIHRQIFHQHPVSYYWSTYQSEWAIDIVFRETAALPTVGPPRHDHLLQPGRDALSGDPWEIQIEVTWLQQYDGLTPYELARKGWLTELKKPTELKPWERGTAGITAVRYTAPHDRLLELLLPRVARSRLKTVGYVEIGPPVAGWRDILAGCA